MNDNIYLCYKIIWLIERVIVMNHVVFTHYHGYVRSNRCTLKIRNFLCNLSDKRANWVTCVERYKSLIIAHYQINEKVVHLNHIYNKPYLFTPHRK
jgi:hypothetical protein